MVRGWSEKLETGDILVDSQHRELLRLVEQLHDGIMRHDLQSVLLPVLDGLAAYVADHFACEERLMRAARYPRLAEHKAFHDDLARRTRALIEGYRSGALVLPVTVSQFLGGWVRNHILENDLAMVRWLREQERAHRPAP